MNKVYQVVKRPKLGSKKDHFVVVTTDPYAWANCPEEVRPNPYPWVDLAFFDKKYEALEWMRERQAGNREAN